MIAEQDLIEILGPDNVSCEQSKLEVYSQDMSFENAVMPAFWVKVRNTEDVQNVVILANKTGTPLVPISSGMPHFRGDTIPDSKNAIIVDLSEMKNIIRVDRENRVALFEPGVTFGELIPAVKREGLRLNIPLLPRKSKSVIGSLLEREPVLMPKYQWDIADPLACLNIVFGTGDIYSTGSAAGPGTIEEQWAAGGAQKEASGPSATSLYRLVQGGQGTMGIATWASARCELIPKVETPFLVGSSQLDGLLELVHWLIRLRLVNECFILNNTNLAAITAICRNDDYQSIKDTLPAWILFFNIAGYEYFPEKRVEGQIDDIRNMAKGLGLTLNQTIGRISADDLLQIVQSPSDQPYWKLGNKGTCHDIFFLTINKYLSQLIEVMQDTSHSVGYPVSDIGIYLQPAVQGTSYHCEFNLFYNQVDNQEKTRIQKLNTLAMQNLVTKGAFFSRPYGENSRTILQQDEPAVNALKKVKAIVDPNNIMNPGKLCFDSCSGNLGR